MQTKLSKQIVYNYIKNFCYNPPQAIAEAQFTSDTIADAPFQFNSTIEYPVGAYVVNDGQLYEVIREGKGSWSPSSIANKYSGEVRTGEHEYTSDSTTGPYDTSRFKLITLDEGQTITVYEVVDTRSSEVVMTLVSRIVAVEYIRESTSPDEYDITVEQIDNKYTARWDTHIMEFYEL